MKYTEQKIKRCGYCGHRAIHYRNNTRMGAIGWIINIALILITTGLWLIPMIAWAFLSIKFGGWKCDNCMRCGL